MRKNTTTSKGTITYTYDAAGTKLSKVTVDQSTTGKTITTTTNYMGGMVFESRTTLPIDASQPDYTHRLQFIAHEEGRVRLTPLSGAVPAKLHYDYFLKDHLGNTRMVLTEEASSETYPALSFEGAAGSAEVQNQDRYWENKAGQSINVAGVRTMHSTGTNALLTRKDLGAIGAAKLLKVMSGDKIQTSVQFHYTATNANNSAASGINSLVANITQLIGNSLSPSEVIKSGVSSLGSSLSAQTALANLLNTANSTSGSNQAPKAYLHVLLFNDQFKFDAVNSKVIPVPYTVNSWGTLSRIGANAVSVKKNGYAYVYFSNESNELVYFDNFNLTHERGPVLEETHYYPFGLVMSGISSKALNSTPSNKKKYQGYEHNTDFDLNTYEAFYRTHDPQIGRWWQIDPRPNESTSLYAAMENNPIKYTDALGVTTIFYGYQGNRIFAVNDNGANRTVVLDEKKEDGFYNSYYENFALVPDSKRDLTALSSTLSAFGTSYDVASFENFYDANAKSVPATNVDGTSTEGMTNIKINGKSTKLYAEVMGNLVMKDGVVTMGKGKSSTGDLVSSDPDKLPAEQGKVGHIHTHPVATDATLTYTKGPMSTGGSFRAGLSPADRQEADKNKGGIRNVVVDSKNVYLINGWSSQTVTIPRR